MSQAELLDRLIHEGDALLKAGRYAEGEARAREVLARHRRIVYVDRRGLAPPDRDLAARGQRVSDHAIAQDDVEHQPAAVARLRDRLGGDVLTVALRGHATAAILRHRSRPAASRCRWYGFSWPESGAISS